jgi:hypothetical protein
MKLGGIALGRGKMQCPLSRTWLNAPPPLRPPTMAGPLPPRELLFLLKLLKNFVNDFF